MSIGPTSSEGPQGENLPLERVLEIIENAQVEGGTKPSSGISMVSPAVRALIDDVLRERHEKHNALEKLHAGGSIEFKKALDVSAEIVTDPSRAPFFAERHNDQLIGVVFIECVKKYEEANAGLVTPSLSVADQMRYMAMLRQAEAELRDLFSHAKRNGFFIIPYSAEYERRRFTSSYSWPNGKRDMPQYVMAEASGRHPDPHHPLHKRIDRYADAQFHLAPPISFNPREYPPEKFKPVVRFPRIEGVPLDAHVADREGLNDEIVDKELTLMLVTEPGKVVNIADIVCTEEMSGRGLAATALAKGLEHIVTVENPKRRKYPMKYVTAEIASLKAVQKPDGKVIRMNDLGLPPLFNERSAEMFDHFRSPHCTDFGTAYKLRQKHKILLPGDTEESCHKIIVTWHVKMAFLKD